METTATEESHLIGPSDLEEPINASTEITTIVAASEADAQIGFFAVVFLTVNATLGAGMLTIPYAFRHGILAATCAQLLHVFLVIASLMILSYATDVSKCDSLQGIAFYFLGSTVSRILSIMIFLYSYGACVTYVIIISDQLDKIMGTFFPLLHNQHWYMSDDFLVISIVMVAILPLCYSKYIGFLKFASFFGFCCTTYITILVLIEYLKNPKSKVGFEEIKRPSSDWSNFFSVAPVLTFSYQCQLSWIPTYKYSVYAQTSVTNRRRKWKIFSMIIVSMIICFISYSWTALFGLLSFGDSIMKDVMQNYDPRDPFVSLAMILLIIKTIVVYPVLLFCGRVVIEELFPNWATSKPVVLRVSIATLWVVSSALLAITIPNIAVAINYLGSLAIFFVFFLPGLILYSTLFHQSTNSVVSEFKFLKSKFALLSISILFISFGSFTFVISISQAVKDSTNN